MKYVSTRGAADAPARSFSDILLEGLAPDGGLYLPERYPQGGLVPLTHERVRGIAHGVQVRHRRGLLQGADQARRIREIVE